jgi:thioester reductase-like protein
LITGATGFIGRYILKKWLLETNARCHLLVRSKKRQSGNQRIKSLLRHLAIEEVDRFSDRISLYQADITNSGFGIKKEDYVKLTQTPTQIIHCAAAVQFDLKLNEARRINVGGVKNILRFARKCKNLKRLDYISTAYVSGWRTGIIKETELDMGQNHRNNYERSKFEAELFIRQCISDVPITVYRPSIVICDSQTGQSSPFNGFYRVMWMYLKGGITRFAGYPYSKLDLVPVDYITDVIFSISGQSQSLGSCYHLTAGPQKTKTIGEIQEYLGSLLNKKPLQLIPPEEFKSLYIQNRKRVTNKELKILKELKLYLPYTNCEQVYINRHCIETSGIEPPEVFTYFDRFINNILLTN